jgi:hypothetical protein
VRLPHDFRQGEKEYQIPGAWVDYKRQDVDIAAKQNAIQSCFEKWVNWERETKELYQKSYSQLIELGEVAAACKVKSLVEDVDQELKCAMRMHIDLKSMNYDMPTIIATQDCIHEKYKEKAEELGVSIC